MVKADYWGVTGEQVMEKTGHLLAHWKDVLNAAGATTMKSAEVVALLHDQHAVPRYWARTLATWFNRANS